MTFRQDIKNEYAAMRIGVVSGDRALLRKLELELLGAAEISAAMIGDGGFDIIFVDTRERYAGDATDEDNKTNTDGAAEIIRIIDREGWREGDRALPYPFAFRELRELISGGGRRAARLSIDEEKRQVRLDGELIRLTEREHKLLLAIVRGGGEFVGRDELVRAAFGEDADGGILNVYVHYLREKLERCGEKLILSSRRGGYRIDEKYLGVEK